MNLSDLSKNAKLFLITENFKLYTENGLVLSKEHVEKFESHLNKINKFFNFPALKNKINYYFVSKYLMAEYAGNESSTGRANLSECSVISIYPFHPHEVTHVIIFFNLGRSHHLLEEGLAVLFGRNKNGVVLWADKPIKYWINEFKSNNNFPDINELVNNFDKFDENISYPVSAYYVKNIIDKIGVDNFKKLFKSENVAEKLSVLVQYHS